MVLASRWAHTTPRKKILFVAEAVTLAHVVRPLVLAQSLESEQFDVHFACANRFEFVFAGAAFRRWEIKSIACEQFFQALSTGSRLYSSRQLTEYIEEDLRLLQAVRPDLVVGDFRLSLAISAPLAGIPYAAIANAYWSPFTTRAHFPLPDVRLARLFGRRCATELFHFAQPAIFAYHARPLNKLRKKHGLSSLGNLLDVYTHGDYTLYPDLQTLFPTAKLPVHHHYIGPIQWSPDVGLPHWWEGLDAKKPIVYVNLGSSGPAELLPTIMDTLGRLPLTIALATAGRWQPASPLESHGASEYLPGDRVAEHAALVICNGGSPSVYQALAKGVPVIGIASNLDQFLCMSAVETAEAGLLLRAGQVFPHSLQKAVETILREGSFREKAQKIAGELAQVDAVSTFRGFLKEIL